jgi:hypothetical protein
MTKNLAAAPPAVNSPNSNHQVTTADRLLIAVHQCIQAGWPDPPMRVLASRIHRGIRTVERLQNKLEASGRLRITRRKIGPKRNATNVYEVIEPGGDIHVGEVLKANTNTRASRPPASIPPHLEPRIRWTEGKLASTAARLQRIEAENARLKQEIEFFRRYCRRGEQIANARTWRSRQDEQAVRLRMLARVGSYDPPPDEQPPPADPVLARVNPNSSQSLLLRDLFLPMLLSVLAVSVA